MIYGLGWTNWMRLIVWLAIGLVFYFSYGRSHSRINAPPPEMPEGIRADPVAQILNREITKKQKTSRRTI